MQLKDKFKILLLKLALTKKERQFISSGLISGEERYRDRYNDIKCESYKSKILKNNIPKLVRIREIFEQTI
jgi:hypothetical protein